MIAQPAATAGAGGISARRTSRTMFSWLMPVLDKIKPDLDMGPTSKQVIHNRVSSDPSVMMPFNKSYASGIYAFVSAFDVDRIGLVELNLNTANPYAVNGSDRNNRIKVTIEAYRNLISGQIGASLPHAVPHGNPVEILVAYSETGPLPFPVSPMYSDYISKTVGVMPQNTALLYWGADSPEGVCKKSTIDEIFTELLGKV